MKEKKDIDQLIQERPDLFDDMDCGDPDRETGINVPVPDWMKKRMEEVAEQDAQNKKQTEK